MSEYVGDGTTLSLDEKLERNKAGAYDQWAVVTDPDYAAKVVNEDGKFLNEPYLTPGDVSKRLGCERNKFRKLATETFRDCLVDITERDNEDPEGGLGRQNRAKTLLSTRDLEIMKIILHYKERGVSDNDIREEIVNRKKYHRQDEEKDAPLVVFDHVSLTYGEKGDKPAVKDLSFKIPKGAWVGLIGGTGSGKSTTISLLERLYEPSEGKIFYRGKPLDDYDLDSLREEISLVSQKPSLFKGSIRSNLLLGKKDATEEEMTDALKRSLAYEFVSKYRNYLDHPVDEGGANLAGGQKQRLLIARALLKGGDLLILDDSTSALDYLSDQKVRQNISSIPGLTKIIVSQRAGSLKDCDLILVFDKGRIIAQGTHQELLRTCSVYEEIYEMQKKGAKE